MKWYTATLQQKTNHYVIIKTAAMKKALKISGIIQPGTAETVFSVVLLLIALLVASFIIRKGRGNPWYAFPVIWGLIGVVIANIQDRSNYLVAITAGIVAIAGAEARGSLGQAGCLGRRRGPVGESEPARFGKPGCRLDGRLFAAVVVFSPVPRSLKLRSRRIPMRRQAA